MRNARQISTPLNKRWSLAEFRVNCTITGQLGKTNPNHMVSTWFVGTIHEGSEHLHEWVITYGRNTDHWDAGTSGFACTNRIDLFSKPYVKIYCNIPQSTPNNKQSWVKLLFLSPCAQYSSNRQQESVPFLVFPTLLFSRVINVTAFGRFFITDLWSDIYSVPHWLHQSGILAVAKPVKLSDWLNKSLHLNKWSIRW